MGVTSLQDINKLFSESYEIVSLIKYLAGVEKRHFEIVPETVRAYESFEENDSAATIRHLCMLRTAFIRNYQNITREMLYNMTHLSSMPEYVPAESVACLEKQGIIFRTDKKPDVNGFIRQINHELSNRINSVQPMFPTWIKWDYIRPLFIMPGGSDENKVKKAMNAYNANRNRYPYQAWINWEKDGCGNILLNDKKFISLLYEAHGDSFEDKSLITGTKKDMLGNLYDFIESHKKVLMVVDCENSDPVKLAAALMEEQTASISKITFFDSANTTPAWKVLCDTGITKKFETERKVVSTLYEYKSQVDMQLAVDVTKEVFLNQIDAVILVSSDSDYWTLIKSLPDTDFLVMLEKMKSGSVIRDTLESGDYQYCFIDDFCTSKAYTVKTKTILRSIQEQFDAMVNFNLRDMIETEAKKSWLTLTKKETDNLFALYMKNIHLKMDKDGTARLILKD